MSEFKISFLKIKGFLYSLKNNFLRNKISILKIINILKFNLKKKNINIKIFIKKICLLSIKHLLNLKLISINVFMPIIRSKVKKKINKKLNILIECLK